MRQDILIMNAENCGFTIGQDNLTGRAIISSGGNIDMTPLIMGLVTTLEKQYEKQRLRDIKEAYSSCALDVKMNNGENDKVLNTLCGLFAKKAKMYESKL